MAIQENDIGLVSFEEFDEHQTNADDKILHVTQTEKDAWNGKAGSDDLKGHKEAVELDHPDGSVTSDKIANEAVTKDKLSAEVQNKMTAHDNHAANIENPHQTSKAQVGLGNVDNVKQAAKADFDEHTSNPVLAHPDGSVTTEKIADKGVTAGKIADAAVGTSKIATVITENGMTENNPPTTLFVNRLTKPSHSPEVGKSKITNATTPSNKQTLCQIFSLPKNLVKLFPLPD